MTDPRTPVDDLRAVAEKFRKLEERLAKLEAPSGTQAYQAVKTLQATVDELSATTAGLAATTEELAGLVASFETRLDNYLETEAPAVVDARVATQIAAILAGNVTIGGNLTVNGPTVKMIGVHDTDVSGLSGRFVVWVAGDGTVGHT